MLSEEEKGKIEITTHHRESSDAFLGAGWYQKTWNTLDARTGMASSQEGNDRHMYAPAADGAWKTLHDIRPHYTVLHYQPSSRFEGHNTTHLIRLCSVMP